LEEAQLWFDAPVPTGGANAIDLSFERMLGQLKYGLGAVREPEPPIEHLLRIKWLTRSSDGRLGLSRLGQAMLATAEQEIVENPGPSVVVLGTDDPLAYPKLIGKLTEAGEGLLADPYLRVEHVHELAMNTRLKRLMTSRKLKEAELAEIGTYLRTAATPHVVEVRIAETFHDRFVIGEDHSVHTFGASLNGINRVMTVMSPIPEPGASALMNEVERLWAGAEVVPLSEMAESATKSPRKVKAKQPGAKKAAPKKTTKKPTAEKSSRRG
jgi:hypothetical protein